MKDQFWTYLVKRLGLGFFTLFVILLASYALMRRICFFRTSCDMSRNTNASRKSAETNRMKTIINEGSYRLKPLIC